MKEGSTEKCLKDYLSKVRWGTKKSVKDCKEICEFTGMGQPTMRRWFIGTGEPLGMSLLKVRFFLESKGYKVHELKKLDERIYDLSLLLAYNFIDTDKVYEVTGLANTGDRGNIFRLLHGHVSTSEERFRAISSLLSKHQEDIKSIKQLSVNVKVDPRQIGDLDSTQSTSRIPEKNSDVMGETVTLLTTLGGLATLLGPKLDIILSDKFSAEDRQIFRELAGGGKLAFDTSNTFYQLYQKLNALCSERARQDRQSQRKENGK